MWKVSSLKHLGAKLEAYVETKICVPWIVATGCCRVELENVGAATYDWSRLGVAEIADDPSQADVLIVAGWINESLAEELKKIYSQLGGTRSVIAVGACALSGSPYAMGIGKVITVSDILPVDVLVPGCPPRPEILLEAVRVLVAKRSPKVDRERVLYEALKKGP